VSNNTLSELAYETALRALDIQERGVEQLRARAGMLLAASSVTASFLGAQTIQHTGELGTLGALALISLAVSVLACVYVLLPKTGFVFSLNAATIYESLFPLSDDDQEMRRRLAYWLEGFWQANQDKVEPLGQYFFAAAVGLVLQFAFWSWALADKIS
jgi:hypothetical protein